MEQPPKIKNEENIERFIKYLWSKFTFGVLLALLLFLLMRFVFEIVKVNAKDMQASYHYGDVVLVKRLFNKFSANDVVYFRFPLPDISNEKTYIIQRLAGISGDTVELKDKILYVNNLQINDDSSTYKHNYFIKAKKYLDSLFKVKYHLTEGGEISSKLDYSYALTLKEKEQLEKDSSIENVTLKLEKMGNYDENCFPAVPQYKWNLDQYGKIYIPKKNDTLKLDTNNINLYKLIIRNYENNTLKVKRDSIFINGNLNSYYVTKKNYYFVLSDNRDNASDSRIWGFLPEDAIIGKVICTVKRTKK